MINKEKPFLYFDRDFVPKLRERLKDPWWKGIYADMMGLVKQDFELSNQNPFMIEEKILKQRNPTACEKCLSHDGASRLIRLALAYLITNDIKYAQKCASFMDIYSNRKWILPIETDLTIASWLYGISTAFDWIYSTGVLGDEGEKDSLAYKIKKKVWKGCDWLMDMLIQGGMPDPDNHDLIVSSALAIASMEFPEHSEAKDWFTFAKTLIDKYLITGDELGKDGDWYEGTLRYQCFPMIWLLPYADACRTAGICNYYQNPKIRKMFDVIIYYLTPNGQNLGFNDVTHEEISRVSPGLLIKAAAEYQDGKYLWAFKKIKNINIGFPPLLEQIVLYYDPERIPEPCKPDLSPNVFLRRVGYGIFRTSWEDNASLFAMDCGPHCVHDHLDKSSFEFYYKGTPLILDSGCADYPERAKWFAPEMHNIVVVNGGYKYKYKDPQWGDEAWSFRPAFHGKITQYHVGKDIQFIQGDHSKQTRTKTALRSVLFASPGYLIILDEIKDQKDNLYEAYFHGRGDITVQQEEDTVEWKSPEDVRLTLKIIAPAVYEVKTGSHEFALKSRLDNVMQDFWERSNSALSFVNLKTHGKNGRYLVILLPREKEEKIPEINKFNLEAAEGVKINFAEFTDLWFSQVTTKHLKAYDITTDGQISFIRIKEGRPIAWMINEGTYLTWKDYPLIDSPMKTTFISSY